MKTRLLLLCAVLLGLAAVASAQTVTINAAILHPAAVTLPERIQKIYLAERNATGFNEASGLAQLKLQIESTSRYTVSFALVDSAFHTDRPNAPVLLNWEEVARLTHRDTTALLIVLENYEVINGTQENRVWRIYDYTSRKLVDEFGHQYTAASQTGMTAEAIDVYAKRILLHWEWVMRDLYKGGNDRMRTAYRCLDFGHWERASVQWKKVAADSLRNPKTAAKACYNMALYCELQSDLAGAQQWLARSQRMGNVLAVYYGRTLRERNGETSPLAEQLALKQGQLPVPEPTMTVTSHRTSASQRDPRKFNSYGTVESDPDKKKTTPSDPYR